MTGSCNGLNLAPSRVSLPRVIKPLIDLDTPVPVGRFKTFGPLGPKYEIVGAKYQGPNEEWLVPIRLVDSGEQTEYSHARLQQDPDAR